MIIHPTGTCFDDAAEYFVWRLERASKKEKLALRLAHGIMRATEGHRIAHAWVELGEAAFHFGLVDGEKVAVEVDRAEYCREGQVEAVTLYSASQALAAIRKHGDTSGPWEARYSALCSDHPADCPVIDTF